MKIRKIFGDCSVFFLLMLTGISVALDLNVFFVHLGLLNLLETKMNTEIIKLTINLLTDFSLEFYVILLLKIDKEKREEKMKDLGFILFEILVLLSSLIFYDYILEKKKIFNW